MLRVQVALIRPPDVVVGGVPTRRSANGPQPNFAKR